MSESSSSSGTRPTCATQTRATQRARPPGSADRDLAAGCRRRSRSSASGRPSGSSDRVGLLLPAVARQRLPEVAGAVEQADADERHAEVAGGLEVVAGQDAEAAGVLRQHRGDAELRARSRRSRVGRVGAGLALVPAVARSGSRCRSACAALEPARRSRRRRRARRAARADRAEQPRPGRGRPAPTAPGRRRANRSWVGGCQDQRRLTARSPSAASGSGRTVRTVNRRIALTDADA